MGILRIIGITLMLASCGYSDDEFKSCYDERNNGKECTLPNGAKSIGGQQDVASEEGGETDSGSTSTTDPIDSTTTDTGGTTSTKASTALKFTNGISFTGLKTIESVAIISDVFYLVGLSDTGVKSFGVLRDGTLTTTPFSSMSSTAHDWYKLDSYQLVTGSDELIFSTLESSYNTLRYSFIDLSTLKFTKIVDTKFMPNDGPSGIELTNTFEHDGRLQYYDSGIIKVFGKEDGSLIESLSVSSENVVTGKVSSDSGRILAYDMAAETLTILATDWSSKVKYSTSGLTHNNGYTRFVSHSDGDIWVFSCDETACYRWQVEVVSQ